MLFRPCFGRIHTRYRVAVTIKAKEKHHRIKETSRKTYTKAKFNIRI